MPRAALKMDWSSRTSASASRASLLDTPTAHGLTPRSVPQNRAPSSWSRPLIAPRVPTKGTVIDWKSNRSARICRSTLAAEAIACDDCVDRAYYTNMVLMEILTGTKAHKDSERRRLTQLQVTDCRSLFDAISAENPRTTEKRTYIDIRSIQEFVGHGTIFWTPTHVMWADGLTKASKPLRHGMADWMRGPFIQLKEIQGGSTKENVPSDNILHG